MTMMPPFPDDAQRDAARDEWNAALASGDDDLIETVKDKLLKIIHVRIMDDDENYQAAGYKPTPPAYEIQRISRSELRRGDRFVTVPAEVGVDAPPFAGPPITAVEHEGNNVSVSTINGGGSTEPARAVHLVLRPAESVMADTATWEPNFRLPLPALPKETP